MTLLETLFDTGARANHRQSGGFTALHEVAAIGNADVAGRRVS